MAFKEWKANQGDNSSNKHGIVNGQLLTLRELNSIKIPHLPEGTGVDGRISAEQVKCHIESLNSLFNIIDKEYSDSPDHRGIQATYA